MTTAVIIPTYNERENIPELSHLILALPYPLHLIIVDDNSPDGTGEIADALAAQDERVHVIHRSSKLGLGTAYVAGFHRAFELGISHVMTMDADFSHHPRYIPDLLRLGAERDVVIGSRYVPGGGTRHWHWQRVMLSWGANRIAKTVLGLTPNDCTAGFRLYRREVLESIDLDAIFSNGYSFLIEMLFKVQRKGWRIGEVPILFADRQRGASKISKNEILKAGYTVMRLRYQG
ncbi:MAG: polyprenol monophosphomannose synthase [Ardenticatenales bacterium]|nr:polyprenol monophosphomannose synthase [Ardenticatenales bacterium]